VRFVVDKVEPGQVSLRGHRFSPVSIIPPVLHTRVHLQSYSLRDKRTKPRSLPTNVIGEYQEKVFSLFTFQMGKLISWTRSL
jgi:hypothetical protein